MVRNTGYGLLMMWALLVGACGPVQDEGEPGKPPVAMLRAEIDGSEIGTPAVAIVYQDVIDLYATESVDPDTPYEDLMFAFDVISAPNGSHVKVVQDKPDRGHVQPDRVGEFVIRLTVADPDGHQDSMELEVTAEPASN